MNQKVMLLVELLHGIPNFGNVRASTIESAPNGP